MKLLIFLALLLPSLGLAQIKDYDRQEFHVMNALGAYNPGFESGNIHWTGTPAVVTGVDSTFVNSKISGRWDSTSAGQTLSSKAVALPKTGNCVGHIWANNPSGTNTVKLQAFDGTNVLAESSMYTASNFTKFMTPVFPCPSSGTVLLRLLSVAANEPQVYLNNAYLGEAYGVGSTQLISETTAWSPNAVSLTSGSITNATSTGTYSRNGDRAKVKTMTSFSAASAAFSGFRMSLPPGCVIDTAKVANDPSFSVSLGYASLLDSGVSHYAVSGKVSLISGDNQNVAVTWATTNYAQIAISNTAPFTFAVNDTISTDFEVPCVGWTAQTVVMPDAQGWYVDASISGANPSLGTASVTSYTGIENGSLTMVQNTGSAGVQIGCSSTNAPSGLTCSSGNESLSVAFTPPKTGAYRACVTANHYIDSPAGSINVVSTFQIVETATNAQTILQEGKGKAMSGSVSISGDRREYRSVATCGDFVLSAGAQRMLRLMYETEISGTPDSHVIKADADSVLGQPDVHWTVYPLQDRATAILANSVSTSAQNGIREESSTFTCSGSSSIGTQLGGVTWLSSIGNISSGACAVVFAAGTPASTPQCFATWSGGGSNSMLYTYLETSSGFSIGGVTDTGAASTSFTGKVTCKWAR